MKFMKYFVKLLFLLLMISIFCSNVNAEVRWNYVKSLSNPSKTNSNINLNGYKLYVNGVELQ